MLNSKSDELSSLLTTSNQNISRSNKENIFTRLNSHNVFTYTDKDDSSIEKMPPVTTKLPGRQTNNSLSSMTGNIMIETPIITQPPPPQITATTAATTKIQTASTQSSNTSSSTTSSRKKKAKAES